MAINDNTVAGNFWGSNGGMEAKPLFAKDLFSYFGEYPAEGMLGYVGPLQFDASVGQMYQWLTARDIGIYTDPGLFSAEDIARVRKFTDWMHNPRVKSLLNEIALPTECGGTFEKLAAPYVWMFVNGATNQALVIGTSTEDAGAITANLRWLDSSKTYLVEDISLYNDGVFRYAFKGKKTGAELKEPGFTVDFAASRSLAKAFWIQEFSTANPQVVYADDKVLSYSEKWNGDSLVVNVKGKPNATGTVVVYKDSVQGTEVKSVSIGASGKGVVSFDGASKTDAVPPPTDSPRLQNSLALWSRRERWPYFSPRLNTGAQTNLALGKMASASSVLDPEHGADKAIDGSLGTSWASAPMKTNDQWLEIDFGAPVVLDKVVLREHEHCERISAYKIQIWNGTWTDMAIGRSVGKAKVDQFPPVSASKVRLYIEAASGSPKIDEFAVFQTRVLEGGRFRE